MNETKTGPVAVPGAGLHYEMRGTGPVLLIIQGGAADADHTSTLVDHLASQFTVLTYDRRGQSRSPVHDRPDDHLLQTHSEDAHQLLAAVTEEPAFVLGTSIGALIGLDLLTRHPDRVRRLVAHEPPALHLLPDTDRADAERTHEEIEQAFLRGGVPAAVPKMMAMVGLRADTSAPAAAPNARQLANLTFFLEHDFPAVRRYRLDRAALAATAAQLVPAAGQTSHDVYAHRCAAALAAQVDVPLTYFAGGHGGFTTHPRECAQRLHEILDPEA